MRKVYGGFLLLFAVSSLSGYDWPVAQSVLSGAFGENVQTRFRNGIDIGGGGLPVHPIERGEVIFSFEEGEHPGELPTGIGSFLAMEHEGGLRSLYAHLETGSVERIRTVLAGGDVVGIVGDSGSLQEKKLRLVVYDTQLKQTVNPLVLLPPLADRVAPVIGEVALDDGTGTPVPLARGVRTAGRELVLIADIVDRGDPPAASAPMSPYEVKVSVNGKQVYQVQFAAIREQDGVMLLDPDRERSFEAFYSGERQLRLGPVPVEEGEALLEISATDLSGNTSRKSFSVTVLGQP